MTLMNPEGFDTDREKAEMIRPAPPAVELLLSPEQAVSVWPEHISENKEFKKQVEDRRQFNSRLDIILSRLPRPDISLPDAISENHVTEAQVADLYESLGDLLDNPDYRRVALYIPFEFLPDTRKKLGSEDFQRSAQELSQKFMEAWQALLSSHDVRANFVDGDVLEMESMTEDSPRVVKAAHLLPKLVEQ